MSDTLMAIIGIFVAAILMFMFPMLEFAQKNDEIAQTTVHMAVSDFVQKATTKGEITQFDYNEMVQKIYTTGNAYDIQIEAQIIDDNPRRATTTRNDELLGEYKYYSVYTQDILEAINSEEKGYKYDLKDDDYLIVTVKNTSETLATQLKNVFYRMKGRENYEIGTTVSSIVLNGSSAQVEPTSTLKNIALLPNPEVPPQDPATPDTTGGATPGTTEPETPTTPETPEPPEEPKFNNISADMSKTYYYFEIYDIVFILDTSRYMGGYGEIDVMKNATAGLLYEVYNKAKAEVPFYIGFVQFADSATSTVITNKYEILGMYNTINGYTARGNVNYDAAFQEAIGLQR